MATNITISTSGTTTVVTVPSVSNNISISKAAVGSTTFIGLNDTPPSFTASKFLKVNSDGTAVEFVDSPAVSTILGLSDTPSSFTGKAGKFVKVNSSANAVEFVDDSNLNTVVGLLKTNTGSTILTGDGSGSSTDDGRLELTPTAGKVKFATNSEMELTATTAKLKAGVTELKITETSPGDIEFIVATDSSGSTAFTALHIDGSTTANVAETIIKNGNTFKLEDSSGDKIWLRPPNVSGDITVLLPSTAGTLALTSQITADTNTQNSYTISCVDGDNSDEEKIRLTQSGADGAATDDIVLEAGTGLSIARSGDKITFTNTVTDTNTTDLVTDTSPQLGGDLDLNGNKITSTSNADILIEPNGTGDINLSADKINLTDNSNSGSIKVTSNSIKFNSATVGDIFTAFTNQNKFLFQQPVALGIAAPTSTTLLGIKNDSRTHIICENAAGDDKFKVDVDSSGNATTTVADTFIASGLTYPTSDGTNGQVLTTNGSGTLSFTTVSGGGGDVVDDTTPQLGGNLDVNGNDIVSTSNGHIVLDPNGTGEVRLDKATGDAVLQVNHITNGNNSRLELTEGNGTYGAFFNYDSTISHIGSINGGSDVNSIKINRPGDMEFLKDVKFLSPAVFEMTVDNDATNFPIELKDENSQTQVFYLKNSGVADEVDMYLKGDSQITGNLEVQGKIISTSNGDIDIEPNGTGDVLLGNFKFDADQTVGSGQDNYVLTYDNSTGKISLEASAGGGSSVWTTSGNNIYYNTGNVGIGTASPSQALHVSGTDKHIFIEDGNLKLDRNNEGKIEFGISGEMYGTSNGNNVYLQKSGNDHRFDFGTQTGSLTVRNTSTGKYFTIQPESFTVNNQAAFKYVQHNAANNNSGEVLEFSNASASAGNRGLVQVNGDLKVNDYTTGSAVQRIKLGNDGLVDINDGSNNVLISTGNSTITASNTVAVGYQALTALTSGSNNTAVGYQAVNALTTGSNNTAVGYQALNSVSGSHNTAIGRLAGYSLTSGSINTIIGYNAGYNLTSSGSNVLIGGQAGEAISGGSGKNISIGNTSMRNVSNDGAFSVAIGDEAFRYGTGDNTVAIGHQAAKGASGSTTTSTVAVGYQALTALTTGAGNTAVGYQAGDAITTAGYNTIVGYSADVGSSNSSTVMGYQASGAGSGVVAIGYQVQGGTVTNGFQNTGVGYQANYQGASEKNVSIGTKAGYGGTIRSVSVGHSAGYSGADYGVFIGFEAGYNETGSNKLYIENSNSATPLIYGEFDNDIVKVNGTLEPTEGVVNEGASGFASTGDYGSGAEITYLGSSSTSTFIGRVYYYDGTTWQAFSSSTEAAQKALLGIALGSTMASGFLLKGFIQPDGASITAAQQVFGATNAAITGTAPTSGYQRVMGHAVSSTVIHFNPSQEYIDLA